MTLAQTQQAFSGWLHSGASDIEIFDPNDRPGLSIYQNNYRSQLVTCLEESFAVTRQWIGSDAFHDAVVHHVERMPPSSWTLDAYPRDFPATLALRYPDDAEVVELAELEMALAEVFVGRDEQALTCEQIVQVDWDNAVLRFASNVDLRPLTTNAPDIWNALIVEETPADVQRFTENVALLVWRRDETSHFRIVSGAEQCAILVARNGMPFANLCEQLVDTHGDIEGTRRAGEWLGQWLADGLLVSVVDTLSDTKHT